MSDNQNAIIDLLSSEILVNLKSQKSEESYPTRSADQSDGFIKNKKEKIAKLRRIREELEDLLAEPDHQW